MPPSPSFSSTRYVSPTRVPFRSTATSRSLNHGPNARPRRRWARTGGSAQVARRGALPREGASPASGTDQSLSFVRIAQTANDGLLDSAIVSCTLHLPRSRSEQCLSPVPTITYSRPHEADGVGIAVELELGGVLDLSDR